MIIFITASCHAAANGLDDEYLQQAVAHLQQTERNRALHAVEIARRELIGSLLINQDVWHQDREMSAEQKEVLDFGFTQENFRSQVNEKCINYLMDSRQPWHAGSFIEWVAVKRMLAQVATADMRTFEDCMHKWLPAATLSILSGSIAVGICCHPIIGTNVCCCSTSALCALKTIDLLQKVNRGECIFKAVDWLGCSKAWQRHIASAMMQPMTMNDVADFTARAYRHTDKQKED
jgi:hypothetical protein